MLKVSPYPLFLLHGALGAASQFQEIECDLQNDIDARAV